MSDQQLEDQFRQQRKAAERKAWFWVAVFVLLGVGGRLAYLKWGLYGG